MEITEPNEGRTKPAVASELRDRLGQAKRTRDAKMVVLRLLVDAHKWNQNQISEWKDVGLVSGARTDEIESDLNAVLDELGRLMRQLRSEVENE